MASCRMLLLHCAVRAERRTACSDAALAARRAREVPVDACSSQTLAVDGYNALITVESAMAGRVVLRGQDRCDRDLASVHGAYRTAEQTAH